MRYSVSDTAEYGDYMTGRRIINEETRKEMKKVLSEIQTGRFASNWISENQAGKPMYHAMKNIELQHPIIETGKKLRGMMSWINNNAADDEK